MAEQATQSDACAQMGAMTKEHELFKPFEGTFKAEVKMWMGPGDPMVMTGSMVNTLDLGGRFLKQVYKSDGCDGPFGDFQGRGWWGYNTVDKRFEGLWIDTACTIMQVEHGQVDSSGKKWTMKGSMSNPETGQPMGKRSVITLQDNDHHTMEMYFSTPEGEQKCMEIKYERA